MEKRDLLSYREAPPRLIAGVRCLDFLNTVEWRGDPGARGERLTSYVELARWAALAGVLNEGEARQALAAAARRPRAAQWVLREAIEAREILVRLVGDSGRPVGRILTRFNRLLEPARFSVQLVATAGSPRRVLKGGTLRLPLDRVLLDAADFLSSGRQRQVSRCANPRCGWVFLDASRNRSRRWCSMAACGNTAKVGALRRRQRRPALRRH